MQSPLCAAPFGDTTTYYTNVDGAITSQYCLDEDGNVTDLMQFLYDGNSELLGFTYNGATYFYVKNLQGDVIAVIDSNGADKAVYEYGAYGRLIYSLGDLADVNPMRYRGYYYDSDAGMYYLQSRYYAPEFAKFINSDLPEYAQVQKADHYGTNLFAYCCNDPVNNSDPTGNWKENVHSGYNNGLYYYTTIKDYRTPYGTYYWAIKCGFSKHNARILAFHCNDLDRIRPSTAYAIALANSECYTQAQLEKFKKWQYYHFNGNKNGTDTRVKYYKYQRRKAIKDWKAGKKTRALVKLGYGLHAVQDICAHGNKGKGNDIPAHGINHDKINYDWKSTKLRTGVKKSNYDKARLCETRKKTYNYLKYFIEEIGGKSQVSQNVTN